MQGAFAVPSPLQKYRIGAGGPIADQSSALNTLPAPSKADQDFDRPWHPDSPLFWVGVIAAATFGLAAVSTTFRVGPVRAAASIGKP